MTDQEKIDFLVHELITLAREVRRAKNSQNRISVTLTVALGDIENRALAAAKRFKDEKPEVTTSKKH